MKLSEAYESLSNVNKNIESLEKYIDIAKEDFVEQYVVKVLVGNNASFRVNRDSAIKLMEDELTKFKEKQSLLKDALQTAERVVAGLLPD